MNLKNPSCRGSIGLVFLSIRTLLRPATLFGILWGIALLTFPARTAGAEESEAAKMEISVWKLPVGAVSVPDPTNQDGLRKPLAGFKVKKNADRVQYDAVDFLKGQGMEFPPGSEATYDQESESLVIRNTPKNLELAVALLDGCHLGSLNNVVVELSFYECQPADKNFFAPSWPTFATLSALPASEIKLLDRVSSAAKSGRRVVMRHTTVAASSEKPGAKPPKEEESTDSDQFAKGESGILAEVEPVFGPDDQTFDANLKFRYRSSVTDPSISEIRFSTDLTGWEGYPVVVYAASSREHEGKYLVVTASVSLVNFGGWKLPRPAATPVASPKPGA